MIDVEPQDESADESDLVLAPPRGRSWAERETIAKTYPPVAEDEAPREASGQYPLRSLFVLTLAVAIGMAGHNYFSAKVFAGLLAVIANIFVFGVELKGVDDPQIRFFTTCICVACGVAIGVALLR